MNTSVNTTKSPAELIAAAEAAKSAQATGQAQVQVNTTTDLTKSETPAPTTTATSKSYQFPSAPTTFEFTHSSRRVGIPDGVLVADDPKDIEELDACVRAGIIYDFIDPTITPFAKPAAPLNPNITN